MTPDIGFNRKESAEYPQSGLGNNNADGKRAEARPVNEQVLEWYYHMREEGRTGETKEEYEARIYAKVQAGKELTVEELRFLARTNPVLYQKAVRMMNTRKRLENQLKTCKSKEEAQEVFARAVSGISDKDPDKDMLVAALRDVYDGFMKSDAYRKLPEKEEDGRESVYRNVDFEVDENGYQVVFAQENAPKTFVANG